MLEEQRKNFDKSLEKVTREVKAELQEVKENVNHINAQIIGWFLKVEQVVDTNYKTLKSFDKKLECLHDEHSEIKSSQRAFAQKLSQELENKKI